MPLRVYLVVLALAILCAGATIAVGYLLLPDAIWLGPGLMSVLGAAALALHLFNGRK